jgi:hypothetical protein
VGIFTEKSAASIMAATLAAAATGVSITYV